MTPFFSVVIPLFNKEHFIGSTIQSVLFQTHQDFEIIVVNDGSTDDSLKKVKAINDKRITIYTIKNQGASHARNYGASKANADYIAFLDADDYWNSGFLRHIKKLIDKHPEEKVFASALKIKKNKKEYNATYKNLPQQVNDCVVDYFETSLDHSILHCSSSVFKKTAFLDLGGFDENLKTSEDTDFWIRTGLKHKIAFIIKPLATHKVVRHSLSKTNRELFKAIDFKKYTTQVTQNTFAQIFIQKNIFASAIRYKLIGDKKNLLTLKTQLDSKLLSLKQKTLLALPKNVLLFVINLNNKISSKKSYF
ncbi:glycosyltransferase family 2 protein [Lacinutrix iliipiscaria]|uniref:Glycosyltransferase family 2 protein n=1 Tax=Lacinutrix iliipiscaria TaxID=1230532 RepID=A0ABW5WRQ1_9FLAO